MVKRNVKEIKLQKTLITLSMFQEGLRKIIDWNIWKMLGYSLEAIKNGRMLYNIGEDTMLSKELQAKILKQLIGEVLANKIDSKICSISDKCVRAPNILTLNSCVERSQPVVISVVKEVLNNLPKVALISPLVDSGVASVEVVYLVLKGRMNKRDAFRHLIKEGAGSINSSVAVLGTLLILRALSYIPTPGRIAILIVAKIALKKLRIRR